MLKGRIIKNISNLYTVLVNDQEYDCLARGKFRKTKLTPLVGDIVLFREEEKYIEEILPRTNCLKRPSVSNIDVGLIVASLKKPELNLSLLDKEIVSIHLAKVEPVICFTKIDLLDEEEKKNFLEIYNYYKKIGYQVFRNDALEELVTYLKGKYVVLTGQTGAGKSSLINKLDKSKHLKVGEISEALGRGKHTTRHIECYDILGIKVVDTPGFSALDLQEYDIDEIRDSFVEFKNECLYKDCRHIKEEKCEVKRRVENKEILASRYVSYQKLVGEKERWK